MQVVVIDATGGRSTSDMRTVALSRLLPAHLAEAANRSAAMAQTRLMTEPDPTGVLCPHSAEGIVPCCCKLQYVCR